MGASLPQVDPAVLARAKKGDGAAHAHLYALFAPMVYTLARRILAAAAPAEDVLQETFLEVIAKIASFRGEAEFGFWLRRIAVNKCLMQLRSGWNARRNEAVIPEELAAVAVSSGADEQVALERALDNLSDTARTVVWLHDVEGYTHREIARMMGRTSSFSKSQLARAHERLRILLAGSAKSGAKSCTSVLKTC